MSSSLMMAMLLSMNLHQSCSAVVVITCSGDSCTYFMNKGIKTARAPTITRIRYTHYYEK